MTACLKYKDQGSEPQFLATLCPNQCSMGEDSSSTFISSELSEGKPNLLQQLICSAVTLGDGGLAAIVSAYKRGSLSLSDTCIANRSTSWDPGIKHFGNEERDELISLVSFGNFHIPLFCLFVVLSTEKLFTRLLSW